jgi:hypothetical protein
MAAMSASTARPAATKASTRRAICSGDASLAMMASTNLLEERGHEILVAAGEQLLDAADERVDPGRIEQIQQRVESICGQRCNQRSQ